MKNDKITYQGRLSKQFTGFILLVLLINTGFAMAIAGFQFKKEYTALMQYQVETAGNNLGAFMQDILGLGLPIGSLEGVDKELEKTVSGDSNITYANIVDHNGKIIYSFPKAKDDTIFYPDEILQPMKTNVNYTFSTGSSYNTFIPIMDPITKTAVGGLNIGISKRHVLLKTMKSLGPIIFTFAVFTIITVSLLNWLTKRKIKPLEELNHGALELGRGDLAVRVNIEEDNEIGSLAKSFNFMAEKLGEERNKLTSYMHELELKNEKLQKAQEEILQTPQLILSEKMASLGLLIAGIAHEINTPAGAIANMTSDLRGRIGVITGHMINVRNLSPEELQMIESLTCEITKGEYVTDDGRLWKKTREVRKWLSESGVENEKDVINFLSKYNALDKDRLEPYISLLKQPWVVELADSLAAINVGVGICESSIRKISEIVKALKYYAYTDMDKTSLVDINENIQNTLLLLQNKLKYDIEVDKDLNPVSRVYCTSEINQVWTNLINNAHDAIMETKKPEEKGVIRVETREEDGWVHVKIADDGIGISEETKNRIFDPFFTTKGIGKGTGLGLSIVSGIVKKHSGRISVDSAPGMTTFTVSLPVSNVNEGGDNG